MTISRTDAQAEAIWVAKGTVFKAEKNTNGESCISREDRDTETDESLCLRGGWLELARVAIHDTYVNFLDSGKVILPGEITVTIRGV